MNLFNILFFFPVITSCLNTIIPIKTNNFKDFYNCINNINFFKLNIKYLGCVNTVINQNLEESKVKWPVILSYDRKHKMKKYPSLPVPKMRTEEKWSINIHHNEIIGNIKTKFITITLKIKINENKNNNFIIKKNKSLLMETKVEHKSFIVPLSNNDIESDISDQIIDTIKLVFAEMKNMGLCEIEFIENKQDL